MDINTNEKRKRMVTGLWINNPDNISEQLRSSDELGYQFVVTQLMHPNYPIGETYDGHKQLGRTDRILSSNEWNRLIVGILSHKIRVDSNSYIVSKRSENFLKQQLGFALHLGLPVVLYELVQPCNIRFAQIVYERLVANLNPFLSMWIYLPMVHSSFNSPVCAKEEDTWIWWNEFRSACHYDRHFSVVLELPRTNDMPSPGVVNRWLGEPVKALVIPTSLFMINMHGKYVLSRDHQELIKSFMAIDVQFIIRNEGVENLSDYSNYITFLGKKLYVCDSKTEFSMGVEDYLQSPLQPLSEHLETNVYEVFEKDNAKYLAYQEAIQKALDDISTVVPVVMVLGAGRGPIVQAALNAAAKLERKIKLYAVEKNPYAVNTLLDRNLSPEWSNRVVIVEGDMRTWTAPELADLIVSELLGSFGDNELSPECLDGAQKCLKPSGICIPCSYQSYLAPLQSTKLYNEVKANRLPDRSLRAHFDTPYVVRLVNVYQIAPAQPLFQFHHPNRRPSPMKNECYSSLAFRASHDCVLTALAGFFDTVLYKDTFLSIHPETHSLDMFSWFPMIFPLQHPVQIKASNEIKVSFWRREDSEQVWYEWCLTAPYVTPISNSGGKSYSIKKRC